MLILSLLGLALIDALNPFSIAAMVLILATDRPIARGTVFIAGTLAVYIALGILLVEGWTATLSTLLPLIPIWLIGGALVSAGALCVWLALYLLRQDKSANLDATYGRALTLPATLAFAVVSTLSDAPTAVPFFAGAALIPDLATGRIGQYAWILTYCMIYVAPLLGMLAIRIALQDSAAAPLGHLQRAIVWSFRHIFPPILMLGGGWLCWLGLPKLSHLL